MTGSVRRSARASSLTAFPELFRLPTKRPLVYATVIFAGKRETHVFELNRLIKNATTPYSDAYQQQL